MTDKQKGGETLFQTAVRLEAERDRYRAALQMIVDIEADYPEALAAIKAHGIDPEEL